MGDAPEKRPRQTGLKLVLVLTPFLLVLLFGLIEWWLRSRGP